MTDKKSLSTNKLFVGSLPYSLSDSDLQEHFAQCGTVLSAKVITDRYTNQGKGFGFVEMSTAEEAQEAITKLNNSNLGGRTIVVSEARPQEKKEYRSFDKGHNRIHNNKDYQSKKGRW